MTAIPEGFTPHDGGPCPVDSETDVQIIMQNPEGRIYDRDGADQAGWFNHLGWWKGSERWRIIAYRIAEAVK